MQYFNNYFNNAVNKLSLLIISNVFVEIPLTHVQLNVTVLARVFT